MAAASNRIALTSSFHSSMNKIPPFLQKLYKIVSDPATDYVISWSEDGHSFYIHDQAALETDVLPRWFKTNKIAAFVRQLNKYGFRKVTHLQQGVLKRDSEAEMSQYIHPDFHRGREDQLALINEGKRQVKEPALIESGLSSTDPSTSTATVPARQSLDVSAVLTDVRRTQARIMQELAELKQTDRALWGEAHQSLQRYQQQQNTINLIVQFLGNLLGQMGNKEKSPQARSPVPVQHQRLMIEDKQSAPAHETKPHGHGANATIMEVDDDDDHDDLFSVDESLSRASAEPVLETPGSLAPPPPPNSSSQTPPPGTFDLSTDSSENQLMKLSDINNQFSPADFPVQDWSNILSSFGLSSDINFADFLSSLPVENTANSEPNPQQQEDLQSHISEIEKTVDHMNTDIESLTNLLALSPNPSGLPEDINAYINYDPVPNPEPDATPIMPPLSLSELLPESNGEAVSPTSLTKGQKRKSDVLGQPPPQLDMTGSTPLFSVNASHPVQEPPARRQKNR